MYSRHRTTRFMYNRADGKETLSGLQERTTLRLLDTGIPTGCIIAHTFSRYVVLQHTVQSQDISTPRLLHNHYFIRVQPSRSAAAFRAFARTVSTCNSRFRICARASRSSAVNRAFSSLSAETSESYCQQRASVVNVRRERKLDPDILREGLRTGRLTWRRRCNR